MPSPNMPTLDSAIVYPGHGAVRGHEPVGRTRHDAAVRADRRAVDRRRAASRTRMNARGAAGRALPPGVLRADVPEAREADVRRLPDPRARSRGVPAGARPRVGADRGVPRAGSRSASPGASRPTSTSTTSCRSTSCTGSTELRAAASTPGDRGVDAIVDRRGTRAKCAAVPSGSAGSRSCCTDRRMPTRELADRLRASRHLAQRTRLCVDRSLAARRGSVARACARGRRRSRASARRRSGRARCACPRGSTRPGVSRSRISAVDRRGRRGTRSSDASCGRS